MRLIAFVLLLACTQREGKMLVSRKSEGTMKISSSAFTHNGSIPAKYTCDGSDSIPPLVFGDVPANTKSLALIVDDPDAPGGTFDHWIVWNIPPATTAVAEGKPPQGISGRNGFGRNGYGGPCPPSGEHRYQFKVYALDTMLNL